MPYTSFSPDVSIKATNVMQATPKAFSAGVFVSNSPTKAPRKGPAIMPIGPKNNQSINPIVAPHVPLFDPPVFLANHIGAI